MNLFQKWWYGKNGMMATKQELIEFQQKQMELNIVQGNEYINNLIRAMANDGWININDDSTDFVEHGYAGNADIYSIINYIITTASNVPYKFQTLIDGQWKDEESKLLELINRPNPLTSRSLFIEETLGWKLIAGAYYIYAPRLEAGLNKGQTQELWTMPSVDMKVIGGDIRRPIKGYSYQLWEDTIDADNVMMGRYFNPLGAVNSSNRIETFTGMSPLRAAALVATKSNSGVIAEVSAFKNNGAIGILTREGIDGEFTAEQSAALDQKWKGSYGGAESYGSVVHTPANVKWQKTGTSPSDMRLIESALQSKRQLASVYKMPTQLLNDADGATFSNQNEAQKSVYTNTIVPELTDLGENIVRWLGEAYHPGEKVRLIPDTSDVEVLQVDKKAQVERMKDQWWTTGNEKRQEQNLEELPGLDDIMIPSGVMRLSDLDMFNDAEAFRNEVDDSGQE